MLLLALSLTACKQPGVRPDQGGQDTQDSAQDDSGQGQDNRAPEISQVTLSPRPASSSEQIQATVLASDPDGDPVTLSYAWTADGQAVGGDHDTLKAKETAKGQLVTLQVSASDGSETVTLESEPLRIGNTPPAMDGVHIAPASADPYQDLVCKVANPRDSDEDPLSYTLSWFQDETAVAALGADTSLPGDTVLASQTRSGETWRCEVELSDGTDSTLDQAEITILPGYSVLLIWDVADTGTPGLVSALEDAGLEVTLSDTDEIGYTGSNPAPDAFDAVIHLNGTTYAAPMSEAGQQALVDYVNAGGGYLHTEWSAYEAAYGLTSTLNSVLALERSASSTGGEGTDISYSLTRSHPVVLGVPSSFGLSGYCGTNTGYAVTGATGLMSHSEGGDGVAVRDVGAGRVVGFSHSANYANPTSKGSNCLDDANLQQLFVDGVFWVVQ